MKRLLAGLAVAGLLVAVVAYSRTVSPGHQGFRARVEARNPWNHLRPNNDPADFQFAIVSDRTGGARPGVFERAVLQLNLLQPAFVISVGDLVEGSPDPGRMALQWREFESFIARLQMPFFYVPGNHDIATPESLKKWQAEFGRRYFHFVYRDVLFLFLDTEDPPGQKKGAGHLGADQIAYAKQVLHDNQRMRWTIVAMHRPIWNGDLEKTGWGQLEQALADRPYTVFAGHIHHYQRYERNGCRYYQLATTGGASKLRGPNFGEFDHIVWVTMKKDGPILANLLLDGILPDDLHLPPLPAPEPKEPHPNAEPSR
jgi:hypothetical protein